LGHVEGVWLGLPSIDHFLLGLRLGVPRVLVEWLLIAIVGEGLIEATTGVEVGTAGEIWRLPRFVATFETPTLILFPWICPLFLISSSLELLELIHFALGLHRTFVLRYLLVRHFFDQILILQSKST